MAKAEAPTSGNTRRTRENPFTISPLQKTRVNGIEFLSVVYVSSPPVVSTSILKRPQPRLITWSRMHAMRWQIERDYVREEEREEGERAIGRGRGRERDRDIQRERQTERESERARESESESERAREREVPAAPLDHRLKLN